MAKQFKWAISITEVGIALMFGTKKEASKVMKDLDDKTLSKGDVLKYAHENHITYSYLIKQ